MSRAPRAEMWTDGVVLHLWPFAVVAYSSGIGVNLVDQYGRTIRQVAYYDREDRQWFRNAGTDSGARIPMMTTGGPPEPPQSLLYQEPLKMGIEYRAQMLDELLRSLEVTK